ncbi:MAG TPA: FAD-dependent oxidoreductase [Candidatus Angelobacter sp.]|nr:FAD-dependent oxidoreductase [Candidatus Angelobacter sp.]
MTTKKTFDFAVIGAGVFGAWTSRYLHRSGASVVLLDAYGAGNSRSSSGGETRILRTGYGPDELYTRWAIRSFPLWREFFSGIGRDLFQPTGVMWVSETQDPHVLKMWELLNRLGVKCEKLNASDLGRRYPQLQFSDAAMAVLEPESGVLMARTSVQALVKSLTQSGVDFRTVLVGAPEGRGTLSELKTADGEAISAGAFIFACGAWLPKLFPDLLAGRIFPTRQEVFFFGQPPGNRMFGVGQMPAWLHHTHPDRPYALPDIENRGFKIAFDTHGPAFDPDSGSRVIGQAAADRMREYVKQHVPALAQAPILETRVCQYENTWNGDFLIDHHPGFDNVWLAGGGSGHGFKHGPALGEYLSARILNSAPEEPRFSLVSKQTRRAREVY